MKKITKATGILGLAIISTCALIFIICATAMFMYARAETDSGLSEKELYNATNTYNVNESCFESDGKFHVVTENDRITETKQYHIGYDMSTKNGNQVMSTPQVTVLTHGLGGSARHWSNNFSESNYKDEEDENGNKIEHVKFAYDEQSLISRIDEEVDGANIYWATVLKKDEYSDYEFHIYDITNQKTQNQVHTQDVKIQHITDATKHIVVVFEAYYPDGSNDNIYYQFNYMMSKIAYDLKGLNGGILPKFNLVGHSRGGITNLQYALDHPDMVASLVSLGTPYFGSTTANLLGEVVVGASDGLDDILDTDLYYSYNKRWNDNYETLYKNINANAFGSYHNYYSLIELMNNTHSDDFSTGAIIGIDMLISAINAIATNPIIRFNSYRLVVSLLTKIANMYLPSDKAANVATILFNEINADLNFMCVSWYSDILVPLESQLAYNTGAESFGGADYKGFDRKIRPFIGGDANYIKVSDPMPPVGHNLEARDSVIINGVLSVLNFGTAGFMTQENANGTVSIVGYRGAFESSELVIPETVGDKAVTEIDRFAFLSMDKSGVQKITVPKTVKAIGEYAFSDFTNVTEVCFAADSELESIGMGAFNNCTALRSISLPDGAENIAGTAFINCAELSSVSVSESNARYTSADGVLYSKDKNALIYYPQGKTDTAYIVDSACTEIDYCAVIGNPHLNVLDLNNVSLIRGCGVANCSELRTVIADNLKYAESGVFANTKVFEGADDEFLSVGKALFAYNGSAANLTVSGDYVSIAPFAFAGSETLETVVLEGNVLRNIYEGAFYGCDKLHTVHIKNLNGTVNVSDNAFDERVDKIYVSAMLKSQYDNSELWQEYADKLAVHTTDMSFVSNGGSECADKVISYGDHIGELPVPTRNGYIFEGWFLSSDFLGEAISQADIWTDIADGVTVYAEWSPRVYSIRFVVDVETGMSDAALDLTYTVEDNVIFGASEKVGHTFGGWYADRNFTQDAGAGFDAGETGDKVYYAKWSANTVAVNLRLNDSEKFPATVSTTEGEVVYDSSDYAFAVPTRAGFEFNGWYASIDGNKLLVTDADGIAVKKWNIAAESVDLYADWTRNTYYIKIDADGRIVWLGADGFSNTETPIEFGTVFDKAEDMEKAFNPEKLSMKEGHKFQYFKLKDGTKFSLWESIASKFVSGDTVEIYTEFEKEINFTIDFYGHEIDGINNPFISAFGAPITYYDAPKAGYAFKHWIVTDRDGLNDKFIGTVLAPGTVFDYSTMPDLSVGYEEDGTHIYLEAVYVPNIYTVTFETRHGVAPVPVSIAFGTKTTFTALATNGYGFIGWQTGGGRAVTDPDGNMLFDWDIAYDQTLYANWETIEYTITYILNGGINHGGNVAKYTIESPTMTIYDATRDGYKFMGWYRNADFSHRVYSIPHGSCGDIALYAYFSKIYTVYFDANGGSYVAPVKGIEGQEITLPAPTHTRSDLRGTWNYWGYLTSDSAVSNFGEKFIIGSSDITLKAEWKRYKFNVTFNKNGGSGGTTEIVVTYGQPMPYAAAPNAPYGYNFNGYRKDNTIYYDKSMNSIRNWDIEENTELIASWAPISCIVTLDKQGGTGGNTSIIIPYGSNISFSMLQAPSRKGYYFKGYYTKPNGAGEQFLNENMKIVSAWKIAGNGTVYAYWDAQKTLITLHPDGGGDGTLSILVVYDQPMPSARAPKRSGYNFVGFFIEKNGGGKQYYGSDMNSVRNWDNLWIKNSIANVTTLYACWDEKNCVAEGTMITLADGSKKAVEDLTGNESLLVWNLCTGAFDCAPIMFIDKDPVRDYRVVNLTFSDGTVVKVISEHGFWDLDLNKYVYLDENAAQYIGHRFDKQTVNPDGSFGRTAVRLVGAEITCETTRAFSPVTYGHLCYYVNDMLSVPGGISGLFNIFDVDAQTLAYDADAFAADIAEFGEFSYGEFAEAFPVSEQAFEAFGGRYLKVAIGKGLITEERIAELIERYSEFF